jgi:hypothetical protein
MSFPAPFGPLTGAGYGGLRYGASGYGGVSSPLYGRAPLAGYGAAAYGLNSYGSVDHELVAVVGGRSLSGTQIEVLLNNPATATELLEDLSSYTVVNELGVEATVVSAVMDTTASILLTLSGTTLGGKYTITINPSVTTPAIEPDRCTLTVLTLADEVEVDLSVGAASLVLTFSEDIYEGAGDLAAYSVVTEYPAPPVLESVTSPFEGDASRAQILLAGTTSVDYNLTVGVSDAVDYDPAADGYPADTVGTGTMSIEGGSLVLSKDAGSRYGFLIADESGRLEPDSTFRVGVNLDASGIALPVDGVVCKIIVSDGVWEGEIRLSRIADQDVVEFLSGGLTLEVLADWSDDDHEFALIRNMLAGLVSVLVDGVPVLSGSSSEATGTATIVSGVMVDLPAGSEVIGLRVEGVSASASRTIYTTTWNFVHGLSLPFVGEAGDARAIITTARGPLVKSWGDMVPATKNDVTVKVNGVEVEVASVNPYLGEITLATPIPLAPAGTNTITVDYAWWDNPIFPFASRDTPGLVYDQWNAYTSESNADCLDSGLGAMPLMRFKYSLASLPSVRLTPYRRSPRYRVLELEGYSALTDNPDTLLYDQNPNALVKDQAVARPEGDVISFEGDRAPSDWSAFGVDTGSSDGFDYTLVSGSSETGAAYYHEVDRTYPGSTVIVARVQAVSYSLNGVYTGIGLGSHTNARLYWAGLLEVDGVKHVGVLLDAEHVELESSWSVGPAVPITITSSSTFTTTNPSFYDAVRSVRGTLRFRVASGVQAGVYEVASCGVVSESGGLYTVTIVGAFPTSPSVLGGKLVTAVLEVDWSDPLTLRLSEVDGTVTVLIGGLQSAQSITVEGVEARPADTALMLPTVESGGAVTWGHTARTAGTSSRWSFVRAYTQPESAVLTYTGSTETLEFDSLPDAQGWFAATTYGVATTPGRITGAYGYERLEPFLSVSTRESITFDVTVQSCGGMSPVEVRVEDGSRALQVALLTYRDHELVSAPRVEIKNLTLPEDDGWSVSVVTADSVVLEDALGRGLRIDHAADQIAAWVIALPQGSETADTVTDAVFSTTATSILVGGGPIVSVPAGGGRTVVLGLRDGEVVLYSGTTEIAAFAFDWSGEHHYQLITSETGDTVSLTVDGALLGTATLSDFAVTGSRTVGFGVGPGAAGVTIWRVLSCHAVLGADVETTIGVRSPYWSKSESSIDGWAIPRSDTTGAKNSSSAAVITPVPWLGAATKITATLDPAFGVNVYLPDVSADAILTVEYSRLPRSSTKVGAVAFEVSAASITLSELTYTVELRDGSEFLAPQGMVRDRANMLTSGELLNDVSPEVLSIPARVGSRTLPLAEANINLSAVYSVVVGSAIYAADEVQFDVARQVITLPVAADGGDATVVGVPGGPITSTYLCSQPLDQGITILNEGTPSFNETDVSEGSVVLIDKCDVEEGERGLLSLGKDHGAVGLEFDGSAFSERVSLLTGDRYTGAPSLVMQGGRRVPAGAGVLGAGVLMPVGRARPMRMALRVSEVLVDGGSVPLADTVDTDGWDATPAEAVSGEVVPDDTPATNGACVALLEDDATRLFSRIGPWFGEGSRLNTSFTFSGGAPLAGSVTRTVFRVRAP